MKILVFSDSHGYLENARNVLRRIGGRMDCVFHLGDLDVDAKDLQTEFPQLKFYWVRGNNDYGGSTPSKLTVTLRGKRFLLTHGHMQRVHWGYDTIGYWAEEQGADAVLFGHTHSPVNDSSGRVILFNPGSISLPRDTHVPTFGILDISDGGVIQGAVMEYWDKEPFRLKIR